MPHLSMWSSILDFMQCESNIGWHDNGHVIQYSESNSGANKGIQFDMDRSRYIPNIVALDAKPQTNTDFSPERRRSRLHFTNELPRTPKRASISRMQNRQKHSRVSSLYEDTSATKNYYYQSPNINPLMVASKVQSAKKRKYLEMQESLSGERVAGSAGGAVGAGAGGSNLAALVEMLDNSEHHLFKTGEQRFSSDFEVQRRLGAGSFGSVYLVKHRLDGVEYAVKQCKQVQYTGTRNTSCLREVWALSCIPHHDNIVRYYCSWAEHDYLYIQLEYCNGTSLSSRALSPGGRAGLSQAEIAHLLRDIASALQYLHHIGIVHLDVKPDNVLISVDEDRLEELTDINGNAEECHFYARLACTTYKLADFGLATCHESVSRKCPAVEDGDKYYLPQEILSEDYSDLSKADIFSLGLTVYEAGSVVNVVRDADRWEAIHVRGDLPTLEHCSQGLNRLLVCMVSPEPGSRPTATQVLQHEILANVHSGPGGPGGPGPVTTPLRRDNGDAGRLQTQLLQLKEKENEELRRKLVDMELQLIKYKFRCDEQGCQETAAASCTPIRKCKSVDASAAAAGAAAGNKLFCLHHFDGLSPATGTAAPAAAADYTPATAAASPRGGKRILADREASSTRMEVFPST